MDASTHDDGLHKSLSKRRRRPCRSKNCVRARKRLLMQERKQAKRARRRNKRMVSHPISCFEEYQQAQGWVSPAESPSFFSTLRRPLPVCLRVRDATVEAELRHHLARIHYASLHSFNIPTRDMDYELQDYIKSHSATSITRQELVSMIPVALLQIQPHHVVLDLCASPGSKTMQAVDALWKNNGTPTGYVIANELDTHRAHVLAHRCKTTLQERMTSLAIIHHNACKIPTIGGFDRIVCDVPCSGDGTLRKDIKVWKTWHPSYGMNLHPLQIRIAKRGIALLKIGGLMTYSTCSFNPIEDEAVVAVLLATGTIEVVDPTKVFPSEIKRRPGISTWKVLNDDCEEVERAEDDNHDQQSQYPSSLWPPTDPTIQEQLQKCIRMMPQDNDTGGFFIALLRKVKDFPTKNAKSIGADADRSTGHTFSRIHSSTPSPSFHSLFPADSEKDLAAKTNGADSSTTRTDTSTFMRGSDGCGQRFHLSKSLSHILTDASTSDKLNIVYAGYSDGSKVSEKVRTDTMAMFVCVLACLRQWHSIFESHIRVAPLVSFMAMCLRH